MDQSARSEFAILHLDASDEKSKFSVEVINFEIEEALSSAFKVQVYFLSASPTLPFEDIVGRGGALSLHTGYVGDRVWAGVVTEFELIHSEEHTGTPGGVTEAMAAAGLGGKNYKGRSRYRLTIQPDLFRLSLRKNSRIFQDQNAVEIVKLVLKDWNIEIDEAASKLTEEHPKFDYKVQYQETDFDFVSRILEDAGISYWIRPSSVLPTTEKKKGNEITKVILLDAPTAGPSLYDGNGKVMPYLGDGPEKHHDMGPHMWLLSAKQWPKPLKRTIRDHDFHVPLDTATEASKDTPLDGRPAIESKYEWYDYEPGAYWYAHQSSGGATADAKYQPGTAPKQKDALPLRRYQAALASRTKITFKTNAMDVEPSALIQIGKKEFGYDHNHPHPAFATDRKILVVARKITGQATGSAYESECIAVYADQPYRPLVTTPKPRIHGLQSAVVVGPSGQEIHVDEFARVRVQFPWDRYGKFTDDSSCWIRVSHAWTGNQFGFIAHPRVGHEVLVAFYEGDPDKPVIVGRVYNDTTMPPYAGPGATKSGFKSNSTGGGSAGFNEMSFEDSRGSEMIHFQAQKDLSYVVNDNESHDIGTALAIKVGKSESHDIGQSLAFKVGMTESHEMFQSFNVKVGIPGMSTEFKMDQKSIVLSTGKASITLSEDNIFIEGKKEIHIHSGKKLHISSSEDVDVDAKEMTIDTVQKLLLNCQTAEIHEAKAAEAGHASPPAGPSSGAQNPPQWKPSYNGADPVQPGPLEQVNVGDDVEEKPKKAADTAIDALGAKDPLKAIEAVGGKVADAKSDLTKLLDFGKAIKDGNIGDAIKNLPGGLADVPIIAQAVKAAHGIDMTLETLAKDINAQIVEPLQSSFATAMKVVDEHIPGPVKDVLASKLGQDFKNAAVKQVLKDIGVDGGSFGDLASKGMDKLMKEVGIKEGKSALSKALFKGATDELHGYAKTAFGDKGLESLITENFGGKAAKSTPVETAAKALTTGVKGILGGK